MRWLTGEPGSAAAARLLGSGSALHAPDLLFPEFSNALWKKVTRKEITADEAEDLAAALETAEVSVHATRPLMPAALLLACTLQHPAYDCFYLALAQALDAPLVTADRRLLNVLSSGNRPLLQDLVHPLSRWD